MALSKISQNAFDRWIKVETCFSGHVQDENRFFSFVWSVVTYSRKFPDESTIRNLIVEAWDGRHEQEYLEQNAREYSSLYITLYDFAKRRGEY